MSSGFREFSTLWTITQQGAEKEEIVKELREVQDRKGRPSMVPKLVGKQQWEGPGVPGDTLRETWKLELIDMVSTDAAFLTSSPEAIHPSDFSLLRSLTSPLYCVIITRDS